MKNYFIFIFALIVLFSCNSKEQKAEKKTEDEACANKTKKEKKFAMYEMSEMAVLMEQMYIDNQRLKQRIKQGDTIGKFPNHFLKIHKAVMTDSTENDSFFKEQAVLFINAQELIYKDPKNAQAHFNEGIDACVRCHEVKCGGPIPKIKKLYIK